jgi:hypothetical protein
MPNGFPSEFPIYPCSQLTYGVAQPLEGFPGVVVWVMDWETRDSVDPVLTFYNSKLNEGDWTCATPPCVGVSRAAGGYLYPFYRKSKPPPNGSGNMTVTEGSGGDSWNSAVGVTKILLGWTP